MIALALVSETHNNHSAQWQFDKIMAAIAYDFDIQVVFIHHGIKQLETNKAWNSLTLYGVDQVFYLAEDDEIIDQPLIDVEAITFSQFHKLLALAEIIL